MLRRLLEWYVLPRFDKMTARVIPVAAVVVLTTLFVAKWSPYIRIDNTSGQFSFRLPADFRKLELALPEPIAAIDYEVGAYAIDGVKHFIPHRESLDPRSSTILVRNAAQPARTAVPANVPYEVRVTVRHRARRPVDFITVRLDGHDVEPKEALLKLTSTDAEVLRARYVQDVLERLLTVGNRGVGNVVVTAMCIVALWQWTALIPRLGFFLSKTAYVKVLNELIAAEANADQPKSQQADAARRRYIDYYHRTTGNQRVWRVLGPALGFLFTVTSLVAGIRPIPGTVATTEMGALFSSLQLALISTVVGLAMRIGAMLRLRIEQILMGDAEQFFAAQQMTDPEAKS